MVGKVSVCSSLHFPTFTSGEQVPLSPCQVPYHIAYNSTKISCCKRCYRNDILRKQGIIPEKPQDPEPLIQEALVEAERKAHDNRLEDKDLDELAALEDEEDEEFLEQYR